ncbi:MAG: SDR family oxidoreductase [Clostridiales bacterium]|nr:SDR family oxidoreductase [Clostridiales bacterium]
MESYFKDKIVLVTGGTSGIGREIAKQLLEKGCKVIINYGHNEELFEETKNEFIDYIENIKFIKADISNENEVIKMFEQIDSLDYLVNNAGTNIDGFIEHFEVDDFKKVVNVNLIGKFICTKYAIPLLKNSKTPSIVNIASRLGVKSCIEASAYCAAEAGIINFTETCALEFSKYGIRVNAISPGLTKTPLALKGWSEEERKRQEENNPLKRLGETADIANTVLFLLSDRAGYINGQNIIIDGGAILK